MSLEKIADLLQKIWELGKAHAQCAIEAKNSKVKQMHLRNAVCAMNVLKSNGVE